MWLRQIFSNIKTLWRSCRDQLHSRGLPLCHWVPWTSKILLHQCSRNRAVPSSDTLPPDSVYIFHPLLRDLFPYRWMHYWYTKILPWFQGSLAMQIHIHNSLSFHIKTWTLLIWIVILSRPQNLSWLEAGGISHPQEFWRAVVCKTTPFAHSFHLKHHTQHSLHPQLLSRPSLTA